MFKATQLIWEYGSRPGCYLGHTIIVGCSVIHPTVDTKVASKGVIL